MIRIIKRYGLCISVILIDLALVYTYPSIGYKSIHISLDSITEVLIIIPPTFVLLGLLDVWVKKDTMIKLMGEKSGLIGMAVAYMLGSFAAGPLYVAFPMAGMMLKKGSRLSNVLIFLGAWSTTKIPMLIFEVSSMGWKFMAARFVLDVPGVALIAWAIEKMTTYREKELIYEKALSF